MASANESQGLKIAVAIFVSLTVILAVTAYFMYSEYAQASEELTAAQSKIQQETQAAGQALSNFRDLRDRAGYSDLSDASAVMDAITKDQQALVESMKTELAEANQTLQQIQQAAGASQPEAIERYQNNINELLTSFETASIQNPTFKDSLETLADMAVNEAELATALAADNVQLRNQLEQVNRVNQSALNVQTQAAQNASQQLNEEHETYRQMAQEQNLRIDQLQTQLANKQTQLDELQRNYNRDVEDYEQRLTSMLEQLNYFRTQTEKSDVVLDNPDGYVTYVDYTSGRVRTNLTRSMGARPQMIFSVFDKDAPGLPSDNPKARIKLVEVNEQYSMAAIEEQFDKSRPLRYGDQVYSAAWSPGNPQRFALLGKIDMDRDGVDDRDDLKRLIEAAGGIVVYDLPPPGYGQEQGELTPKTSWYVIDERDPIRYPSNRQEAEKLSEAQMAFQETQAAAIEKARRLGIRPLPVERLLSSLGYSYGMLIPGEVEAADTQAIEQLLNPGGLRGALPGTEEFERFQQNADQGSN